VEIAHKCKSLASALFLNPTENITVVSIADNDDVMVVMSNLATRSRQKPQQLPTLVAAASTMYGTPKLQYINAITIAPNHVVADTGATSIFVMDRVDVANKRVATKPLTVNLPDGRKVKSTHACNINIPGLPVTLTEHIIPDLKTASLIGIHPLCKVGCKVVFDNEKCDVVYKGRVILRGYKDPRTDLWTLPITTEGMQTTPSQTDLPRPCPGIGRARTHPMPYMKELCFCTQYKHGPITSNLRTNRCATQRYPPFSKQLDRGS
jgi:hypothetical protein